ncbi:MAG: hypothetical protein ACI8S6_003235 [Myxococcota bacterium]|jgi:hypothetical protein
MVRASILRMVMYFDVFKHPLTIGELERLVAPGRRAAISAACDALVAEGLLEATGRYRHSPGHSDWAARRAQRARWAEELWPRARRAAAVLARLPFVRGVCITGSLSKSATTPDGDVDFLLLSAPGRVWSLKTLTQLARWPLPEPLRELFCTNYILSTDTLALDARNLFTAVELATAVPMYGPSACAELIEANPWARRFVPGLDWSLARAQAALPLPSGGPAGATERLWSDAVAVRAERSALSMWDRYWNRKYDWLPDEVRARRFQRQAGTATNHLHDFQDYVLREASARLSAAGLDEPVRL